MPAPISVWAAVCRAATPAKVRRAATGDRTDMVATARRESPALPNLLRDMPEERHAQFPQAAR